MPNLDVERLRSWIGREESASDTISPDLVRRFSAAIDIKGAVPSLGDAAPLLINYCLAPSAMPTSLLAEDGHPEKGGFLPPVPLPRRMWAGSSLAFSGALRVGDLVERVSQVADVAVKEGRTGTLCFVTVEHKLSVLGTVMIEETQTIVYREASTAQDASNQPDTEAAAMGSHNRQVGVSVPLLFRYSALTFNAHRIHYDRPYAVEVEHYSGLVIHAPLQATLLLNYAAELKGKPPSKFVFRAASSLFDDESINLHAAEEDGKMKLWTARQDGPVAMIAEAAWG
ncbi:MULTISPECIES: FAS1-like dehydratase domain-containing protein [Mesorhizobium]|uniref:FAS1-like dehydratase domain-containing protein n=1 Tax=Mesorhizobium TaxID=68287 RepID=UPI0007EDDE57|nr:MULTISPECIES: MaoC family dehydratase N-terminal domain-containing protein [Mesorhizobium]TPJ37715.1 protein dehydratase [Mesorhizobium sp. B2-6-6]ARP67290.1 protein dehydratase [Mesorhizobium sp. WSM1497]MCA0004072.1 MaoC family dehydratase N-terminal domain-containing protein [Mesorhizobium sp. B264B2A]MCA0010375.1 MaoC family dehydratase N-terminal domain-containing protein [Mesorhizobium sp. B264B1B]MCA0016502.1 MaoC family dehydratase N-terminal domain-containing protein [Mesorhizobium